jgi:hypothetical protein
MARVRSLGHKTPPLHAKPVQGAAAILALRRVRIRLGFRNPKVKQIGFLDVRRLAASQSVVQGITSRRNLSESKVMSPQRQP